MSLRATWRALGDRLTREQTLLVSLAVAYLAAGRIGLSLSYGHPAVTLVWPPSGLALGAFLVLGYRIWPVILGSALVLYAFAIGPTTAAVLMAAVNTLEGTLAAYLVNRYASGRHALQSPRDSLRFAGVVLLAAITSGATLNTLALVLTGYAYWTDYGRLWMTLSLGSVVGMLVVTPLLILHSQGSRVRLRMHVAAEGAVAVVAVVVTALVVFHRAPVELRGFPTELLCLPLLLWVAFRLGRRAAAASLVILAVVAIYGTLSGYGPFVRATPVESLTIVQLFVAMNAVITISLAALASEYSLADAQLRELVVTDPLTGLPNYRRLLEVLAVEIAAADRGHRQLAVVFFDMDGLKDINDELGHLVGSRAVCRFAETLRAACRTTDTAARYGGDEFVAVLSETDQEGARHVVRRIAERLEADPDQPALSVSAGIAIYPRDGGTPTTLLSAADRALYAVKAEKAGARRRNVVGILEWNNATGSHPSNRSAAER
jgi:diguanylate cyclase (GGDEF)-like protein